MQVDVVELGSSQDADYYIALVERVIKEWGIRREDIIGISVDNTNVNPCFVRKMGLTLLPCVMHVCGLMLDTAIDSFNCKDLFGWSSFFGHSHPLRAAASSAGVLYRVAMTAGTRMGSVLPFIAELSDPEKFAVWRDFANTHPPASARPKSHGSSSRRGRGGHRPKGTGRGVAATATSEAASAAGSGSALAATAVATVTGPRMQIASSVASAAAEEATRYGILVENMADVFTLASLIVLHELLSDLGPLIKASQCHVCTIPFDFWDSWDSAETNRVSWYNDPEIKLDALMAQHGIHLDAEARTKLVTTIEYAVEKMDEKVDTHLMETCVEVSRLL